MESYEMFPNGLTHELAQTHICYYRGNKLETESKNKRKPKSRSTILNKHDLFSEKEAY